MSCTRTSLAVLAVWVLLLTGTAGCGSDAARGQGADAVSPSPVGRVLDDTDSHGRHYREVDEGRAPEIGIEVQPDPDSRDGDWDVRMTLRDFRLSPVGVKARAVAGRGLAYLFVDGHRVARLRTLEHRLPASLVPRGTHQVTIRLYADDGTVWAVDGEPVESTADITASQAETALTPTPSTTAPSGPGARPRTEGRGSPDRAGKAS